MEQAFFDGIVLSATYALIALGITLIFSIMSILNFAHGQMFMIGGFAVYYVYGQWHLPFVLGLLVAALGVGAIGVAFDVLFFRRMRRRAVREENSMLLAVGTALLLENVALFAFGEKERGVPDVIDGVWRIGDAFVPVQRLLVLAIALGLIGGLLCFVQYTRAGRAMRALAQDREAAILAGVDVDRMTAIGFGLGAGLAGLAGALLVTVSGVNTGIGTAVSTKAFIMIMIGGAGVVAGSLLGAVGARLRGGARLRAAARLRHLPADLPLPDPFPHPAPARHHGQTVGLAAALRTRPAARRIAAAGGVAVVLLAVIPAVFRNDPYWLGVATNACVLGCGSLGLWLMFAIGRIDIAQGAFAMLGGYATAILSVRYGVPFWLCLPASALVAACVSLLIGLPILRLRGVYFAMVTLSLSEVARLAALNGGALTRGAHGFTDIPQSAWLATPGAQYILAALLLLLALLLVWRIAVSRIGRIFRAMRQNEDLAASFGIEVARYRVIAFALASGIGGSCGSFFAEAQQNIFPATYSVTDSINFMLYCFLGGLDAVLGPVVGAFLLVFAFELLDALQRYQALLYGVLMIAGMLVLPNGLLSLRLPARRTRR